ncbi:hypothetical protein D3C73_1448400 [compost metagenome]
MPYRASGMEDMGQARGRGQGSGVQFRASPAGDEDVRLRKEFQRTRRGEVFHGRRAEQPQPRTQGLQPAGRKDPVYDAGTHGQCDVQ